MYKILADSLLFVQRLRCQASEPMFRSRVDCAVSNMTEVQRELISEASLVLPSSMDLFIRLKEINVPNEVITTVLAYSAMTVLLTNVVEGKLRDVNNKKNDAENTFMYKIQELND